MTRALPLVLVVLWACPHHDDFDPAGYPCDAAETCLSGYVCHPFTNQCAEALAIGCRGPGYICPSDIDDGDPCPSVGSFIPCEERGDMDCSDGCRTCRVDLTWGACQTRNDAQP
jgi:hypothetical protein